MNKNSNNNEQIGSYQKIKFIHISALQLLQELDNLPLQTLKLSEHRAREARRRRKEETNNALLKQKRFDLMKNQVKQHFLPARKCTRISVSIWRKSQES